MARPGPTRAGPTRAVGSGMSEARVEPGLSGEAWRGRAGEGTGTSRAGPSGRDDWLTGRPGLSEVSRWLGQGWQGLGPSGSEAAWLGA